MTATNTPLSSILLYFNMAACVCLISKIKTKYICNNNNNSQKSTIRLRYIRLLYTYRFLLLFDVLFCFHTNPTGCIQKSMQKRQSICSVTNNGVDNIYYSASISNGPGLYMVLLPDLSPLPHLVTLTYYK